MIADLDRECSERKYLLVEGMQVVDDGWVDIDGDDANNNRSRGERSDCQKRIAWYSDHKARS